jgi:hypothetical protein
MTARECPASGGRTSTFPNLSESTDGVQSSYAETCRAGAFCARSPVRLVPHENEARRACECAACQDDEGPVKLSCPIQNESGECRGHDTREIADEVLEPRPASGGLGPGERLGDGPDTGVSNSEEAINEYEGRDGVRRSTTEARPTKTPASARPPPITLLRTIVGVDPKRRLAFGMPMNSVKAGDQKYQFGLGSEVEFSDKTLTCYFPGGWRP